MRLVGLINDDSTPVGSVHLGVVHVLELERPEVRPREDGLAEAEFVPIADSPGRGTSSRPGHRFASTRFCGLGEGGIGRVLPLGGRLRSRLTAVRASRSRPGKPPGEHDGSRPGRNGRNRPRGRWPCRRRRASCRGLPSRVEGHAGSRERPRSGRRARDHEGGHRDLSQPRRVVDRAVGREHVAVFQVRGKLAEGPGTGILERVAVEPGDRPASRHSRPSSRTCRSSPYPAS